MQRGPNWSALRVPFQSVTGWGGCHLNSPTGGDAKGTPLNVRTPVLLSTVPSITPFAVLTLICPKQLSDSTATNRTTVIERTENLSFMLATYLSSGENGDAVYPQIAQITQMLKAFKKASRLLFHLLIIRRQSRSIACFWF